jgi:tetratricopeptide (TPR) repeat protein
MHRLAVLLAAFLLAAASLASAAPADPAYDFYEKQAKVLLKTAGQKVWDAADEARKQGFFAFAIREAERAIEFDPDQADARDFLKYAKKEGKWVRDEEAWKKAPQDNVRPSNKTGQQESEESMQKRIAKWEEETLKRANKFVAARYAELGDVCAAKGYADQAQKGYESALRLDKENEKARKGLGFTKFGKVWLTKKQDEARKAAAKSEVVKEAESSRWEDVLGVKMNKVESAHVRMESPFDVAELHEHCQAAETCYAYYLSDFGLDPTADVFDGKKAIFVLMSDETQWNKWVDEFAQDKEFVRQLSGSSVGELVDGIRGGKPPKKIDEHMVETSATSTPLGRRDQIVHKLTHELNQAVWKIGRYAWIDEGLAFYYTQKVIESTATHCVALKKGDYANGNKDEGGIKDWGDADGWKPLIKEFVSKNNDAPLREIMNQPIATMPYPASVKAWSVCTYLMDGDRPKFQTFLAELKNGAKDQVLLFQNTFDMGVEPLEAKWKEYVIRTY